MDYKDRIKDSPLSKVLPKNEKIILIDGDPILKETFDKVYSILPIKIPFKPKDLLSKDHEQPTGTS